MHLHNLNPNIFSDDVEIEANRIGYGDGLVAAGEANELVVALCADLTGSTKTNLFAKAFPERFIQAGIAEQNMASVASGMAAIGKIPFIASYAMFSPGRSWEQVRTTIAYNNSNVKIVGAHAGVSVGLDGATHQALEDIAIMRAIPNMVILAPCDVIEAKKATEAAALYEGPVYIRLAREKTPIITTKDTEFKIGKAQIFMEKDTNHKENVGIIATGPILHEALKAALQLNQKHKVGASVMNMATVKPLDTATLKNFVEEHNIIVTVEEHQRAGGLGGAVSEFLTDISPKQLIRIGVDDRFGQSGTINDLYREYNLDSDSIVKTIRTKLKK